MGACTTKATEEITKISIHCVYFDGKHVKCDCDNKIWTVYDKKNTQYFSDTFNVSDCLQIVFFFTS